MNRLSRLELIKCFQNPGSKLNHNKNLFSLISTKYNIATRILSLGRDQTWKNSLINLLPKIKDPICLDLACGTGDITFKLAKKYSTGTVYGLDITQDMIEQANKINKTYKFCNIKFINQDMCKTLFENNKFDIITGSYALRNAPDLKIALHEIVRILKPNGTLAILDFAKFDNNILQKLEYFILKLWGAFWGIILHKNYTTYSYIAESLKYYPCNSEFKKIIKDFNLEIINYKKFFLGTIKIVILKNIKEP